MDAHPRLTLAQIHFARCPDKFGGMADGWTPPSDALMARLWRGKLCYLRLHGPSGFTGGDYGRAAMAALAARVRAWCAANPHGKAYIFFNNDAAPELALGGKLPACAVCDAYALGEGLSK